MPEFRLKTGEVVLVDEDDIPRLLPFRWKMGKNGYAYATVYMHRYIAGTPDGLDTDHINRIRHDNQKSNLRSVTRRENIKNRARIAPTGKPCSSQFVGVTKHRNKWKARIVVGETEKHLGIFNTEKEAAAAYTAEEIKHFPKT